MTVALVTGGGSGIGAATAGLLAARGAQVVVADVNEAAARAIAADIGEDRGTPVTGDYTAGGNKFTGKIQRVTVELK